MSQTHLVDIRGLRIDRGAFSLRIPAWTVAPGSVVGVVGPNGAGKTTLIDCLAGLIRPTEGTVRVVGRDPAAEPMFVRSRAGFMSDDRPLFDLSVARLLRMLSGYYASWDEALVEELLARFRVDPRVRVRDLSRGQGTSVRIIAALAFRPDVVVLDEPGTGLDLGARRAVLEAVLSVARDPTRSVIISSHQLADVERIADALLVLQDGRVAASGPTDEVVQDGESLEETLLVLRASGMEAAS
ncbi:ABC transporter related protein [Plesiocystis pacifica SIR-1]|uniref:ABC transporter related protein n=1 Tax=Plesiocystis pacifica SIR-1 TaxID=391625 RepID=A6G0H1_9BACT|nr:ABC transporter ATP-binding protein [Plesiocystis pacifica]EDM80617.1 ABC transporter related protein [Plesiocystis pacifica SIR-1]